jgi:chromosome partitioning protein
LRPRDTIAELFDESRDAKMAALVRPVGGIPRVWLVAGSGRMDRDNAQEPWTTGESRCVLRDALREVADGFDPALIECPPNIPLRVRSAMVAADGIVAPLQAEDSGAREVATTEDSIDHDRAEAGPCLTILGFLPTMFHASGRLLARACPGAARPRMAGLIGPAPRSPGRG